MHIHSEGGGVCTCTVREEVCAHARVFLVRKNEGGDQGKYYAMKILKKAALKGGKCMHFALEV